MAVISSTRNGMIGKCGKPFCGDCCATFRQGSGRRWKRIGKHVEKRKENRRVTDEVQADLIAAEDEADYIARYGDWNYWGCSPIEPCHERWCLPCNLNDEFRNGDMDEFA